MTSGYTTRKTDVSPRRKLMRRHSSKSTAADTNEPSMEALFTTRLISWCRRAMPRMTPLANASDPTHSALRQ